MFPLRDLNPRRHFPWVTWLLVLANLGVFLWELSLGAHVEGFVATFGLVPERIGAGGLPAVSSLEQVVLPWFTHMFLHGGWMHLLGNLWFLHIFGDNVEDRLGPLRFLVLYLSAGLLAALTQVAMSPGEAAPLVGASGAISGVLAAYVLYFPTARILTLFFIILVPIPAFLFIGVWFLLQVGNGTGYLGGDLGQSIAWWAHIGGFVAGLVLGLLLNRK